MLVTPIILQSQIWDYCDNFQKDLQLTEKKGMGQSTHGKNYGSKIFETILRRYHSASMIITVNDYHGNDVINVKGGERQKRGQT